MISLVSEYLTDTERSYLTSRLKRLVRLLKIKGDITVKIGDSAESRSLNRSYSGNDYATDVLSFPLHDEYPDRQFYLGDVFICSDTARQQARRHHFPLGEEYLRLIVHGVLHLLGHDHDSPDDSMFILQEKVLKEIG